MSDGEFEEEATIALATPPATKAPAPRDAWAELEKELFEQPIVRRPPRKRRPTLPKLHVPRVRLSWKWTTALAGAVVLAVGAYSIWRGTRPEPRTTRVTTSGAEDPVRAAALSPDGKRVVWVRQGELRIRSFAGGEERSLTLPAGMLVEDLVWLGGEDKVLAAARYKDGFDAGLWRIALDGSTPQKIRDSAHSPALTPDGRNIAFVGEDEVGKSIWTITAVGGAAQALFSGSDHDYERPAWSPDGSRIAFIRRSRDLIGVQLMTASSDGGEPVDVLTDFDPDTGPAWLDARTLVFGRRSAEGASLWKLELDSEWKVDDDPIELARVADVSHLTGVQVAAGGQRVSFRAVRSRVDAFVAALGSDGLSTPRRLTEGRSDHWPVAWSPKGDALVLNVEADRKSEIVLQPAAGGEAHSVGQGRVWAVTGGGDLIYGAADALATRVLRLSEDGDPQVLDELPMQAMQSRSVFRCPEREGAGCVLGLEQGDVLLLHAFDPRRASGKGRLLAKVGLGGRDYGWNVSPDGGRVAVVNGGRTIKLVDLRDGSIRKLSLKQSVYTQNVAWARDGRSLFVTGLIMHSAGGYVLYRVDLRGAARELWHTADRWFAEPVPSPDGERLAFASRTTEADLWLWGW